MLRLRVPVLVEKLGDGERCLCAPVLGVLTLNLLPQLPGEIEAFAALLGSPLFAL